MSEIEKKVLDVILGGKLLQRRDSVLVALSGGSDSVALLHILLSLREVLELDIRAAHLNHRQRGRDSDRDEIFCRRLCESLKVPLTCKKPDGRPLKGRNLEHRLRIWRYDFLAREALRNRSVIATGHTLDDQAETLLLKLFRGSGAQGLSGIRLRRTHWSGKQAVEVIRPLLECCKTEILAYLDEQGLSYCEDTTNVQTRFDRNWIRHELIPSVENRFNPRLADVLSRTAILFADIQDFLNLETSRWLQVYGRVEGGDRVIEIPALEKLHPALCREVVRNLVLQVKENLEGVTLSHVEDILKLCRRPSGKQVQLPGSVRVLREFDKLRFFRGELELPNFEYRIEIPGQIEIPQVGKRVRIEAFCPDSSTEPLKLPQFHTRRTHLIVRNRRPGDRYQPDPERPPRSLKKLLMEQKVPFRRRSRLLVFEVDRKIVWVEGLVVCKAGSDNFNGESFRILVEDTAARNSSPDVGGN